MPRIDPQQLLVCLTPLLAPNGGIKSPNEVIRLANLMEKYSKKLVSKCIYIQILKCTETDLLGEFMAAGGWNLVHNWLNDGNVSANWAFVKEILEMLLLCPVDGNRLKSNHTPKIVKNLSVTCHDQTVKLLASKLVEQWLKIAQQEKQQLSAAQVHNGTNGHTQNIVVSINSSITVNPSEPSNGQVTDSKSEDETKKQSKENVKYKISNKEGSGKLLLSLKRSLSPSTDEKDSKVSRSSIDSKSKSDSEKDKSKHKRSSSSSSSTRKSSSSSKSSHRDKERSSSVSSSSHHRSSSSSKDKQKDSSKSSSSKHSSSSSSRDKDKDRDKRKKETEKSQAEKDKETLDFLTPHPSAKLTRIPKRQHSENSENKSSESNKDSSDPSPNKIAKTAENVERKKPSISIEVRKGDKPKTVKTLNSQFRNHGLAEEPPKPPSRRDLKKPATVTPISLPTLPTITPTIKVSTSPPPKKILLDKPSEPEERIGSIKLIKPKPMLIESIGFMDALSASAGVNKKDPKKRKRLSSGSKKDEPESPKVEAKPLKFYKDTFEEAEEDSPNGEKSPTKELSSPTEEKNVKIEEIKNTKTEVKDDVALDKVVEASNDAESPDDEPVEKRPPGIGCEPDGPPGVLVHPNMPRRKKRAIRWKADEDLTEIRLFELDETERTNVSKTFTEQTLMEHVEERSAFQLGRKMQNDDTMVEQTTWKALFTIDNVPDIKYGSKSLEAEIQAEREKNVLQELYFRHSINDSPHEPDPESYEHLEPRIVPLEDVTGNPDSVNDFSNVQWPAPKGELPAPIVSNAFSNVFNPIASNLGIPPNLGINSLTNPLASFAMSGITNPLVRETQNPIMSPWLSQPPAAFMGQPPPIVLPQQGPGFGNRGNNSFRGNNRQHNNNNGGGNWVRGNARRGICNQFQRTGFCRNKSCPYIHER